MHLGSFFVLWQEDTIGKGKEEDGGMTLPDAFVARMQRLLGSEYVSFAHALQAERSLGLRVNTLKIGVQDFQQRVSWRLTPIPWCPSGFYYEESDQPGKHVWHATGVYYLQDPSAMAVAQVAAPQPGERVLDLCAAPGGKATHLSALMQDQGLLVANEVNQQRVKALAENLERWGSKNVIITSAQPAQLARRFGPYFDCIVVDAPCSGEGMFRKDDGAREQWNEGLVRACAATQKEILQAAYEMLAPGGRLVYSTCTFSVDENEDNVAWLLANFSDLEVVSTLQHPSWQPGFHGDERDPLRLTARLWPHRLAGEGHFLACLRKAEGPPTARKIQLEPGVYKEPDKELKSFAAETLRFLPPGPYLRFGDHVYQVLEDLPLLQGLRVVRPGWHLGELRKGRFIPSHALALSLRPEEVQRCLHLSAGIPEAAAYLAGHTLATALPDGWALVCVDGFPLGWGKVSNRVLKNHYPKGLRR